jgi:DNA invertase Pin-like site-specific DNA recombinase
MRQNRNGRMRVTGNENVEVKVGQKRVAIYCRVSTVDQSCDRQERDLMEFAHKSGFDVLGVWRETASGTRNDRTERKKVMALAQARKIDAILVTELTRWGRSTIDLIGSLQELESRGVSLIALTGLQLDLTTAQGKLVASILAAIAEFEAELTRERVRSGLANARAKGVHLGRKPGQVLSRIRDLEPKILALKAEGKSHRVIASQLGISKNTVTEVVKRSNAID